MSPQTKNNIKDWIQWVIGTIIILLLAALAYSFKTGGNAEKVLQLEKRQIQIETTIQTLNDSKVSREEYQEDRQELRTILFRMEDKIDKLHQNN